MGLFIILFSLYVGIPAAFAEELTPIIPPENGIRHFGVPHPGPEELHKLYPTSLLQKWFEEHKGLETGGGPWMHFYRPSPMDMYWFPARHYIRPEATESYKKLLERYKPEQCIECHEETSPGIVTDWKISTHAQPKKNSYFAERTKEIEKRLGKEIKVVECKECHGPSHDELIMPSAETCGNCHLQQTNEFISEREYNRPNHPQGFEANVIVPWYAELYRMGIADMQFGCDYCHGTSEKCDICHTRHAFKASEGRRPEACVSCHMGFDHPDSESYFQSKMGTIYHLEGKHWDWNKPLSEVIPGKDYRTPTCQYCHMYSDQGIYSHNVVSKGIWRMGTLPPEGIDYKSSLKDFPYGQKVPPLDHKININAPKEKKKRERWIEVCTKCHTQRWGETYLANLDSTMFQIWTLQDRAQKVVEDVIDAGALDPGPEERDPYPLGDVFAGLLTVGPLGDYIYNALLGPGLFGPEVYRKIKETAGHVPVVGPILGVYADFYPGKYNPSRIERLYVDLWFGDKAFVYKGTAHAGLDVSWWGGASEFFDKLAAIESEARMLVRAKDTDQLLKERRAYKSMPLLGFILVGLVVGVTIKRRAHKK